MPNEFENLEKTKIDTYGDTQQKNTPINQLLKSKYKLYERVEKLKVSITTEEATKNAFIMPFLQILGYDVFNPTEILPEYTTDIGTKKGEKVDYAILKNETPVIIIECKHWKENLNSHNSQLHRYFNVSKARFGILTNGITYNFFTDLESQNIMDEKPFLTLNLENIKESTAKELEKFSKSAFDISSIVDSAEALKYIRAIRTEFENEIQEQSDELIKLLVNRFYNKPITASRLEMFKDYGKKAISSSINDVVNAKLKSALNINEEKAKEEEIIDNDLPKIITTEEEIEGFQIIKAILREKIDGQRISYRDTQSYFGILLDNNNRKPICRLYLNNSKKYLELFNNGKNNSKKYSIETLDDIFHYRSELFSTLEKYLDKLETV